MPDFLLLQTGLGAASAALTINRLALGTFFAISGYHKLFNPTRHAAIQQTLTNLSIPYPAFNCWFVPAIEFLGGLALITGLLAPLAAVGLFIICLVATITDGLARIPAYQPLDSADYLDDVLYLPEVLYLIGLLIIIIGGPGITLLHLIPSPF